jgi:LmbE family N-acetylglucosaminyl deacetylase
MISSKTLIAGRILFVGAHCDDIEIGCGGTAAKFAASGNQMAFAIATRDRDVMKAERRRAEAVKAATLLGLSETTETLFFGPFVDGELKQEDNKLREWLKLVCNKFNPDKGGGPS